MAYLKFKDENNQWQDLPAIRGRDGVIQYQAGNGITIDNNTISAIQQDLSNYYTKSEVNNLIAAVETVSLDVVQTLPATGEPNVIYLVPSSDPGTQNAMDEYIYVNNAWEKIGSTAIDMSNYYTKAEIDKKTERYTIPVGADNTYPIDLNNTPASLLQFLNDNVSSIQLAVDSNTVSTHLFTNLYFEYNSWQFLIGESAVFNDFGASVDYVELNLYTNTDPWSGVAGQLDVKFQIYEFNVAYVLYLSKQEIRNGLIENVYKYSNLSTKGSVHLDDQYKRVAIPNYRDTNWQYIMSAKNDVEFTPTGDYNIATKKYVDDAVAGAGGSSLPEDIAFLIKTSRGVGELSGSSPITITTQSILDEASAKVNAAKNTDTLLKGYIQFSYTPPNGGRDFVDLYADYPVTTSIGYYRFYAAPVLSKTTYEGQTVYEIQAILMGNWINDVYTASSIDLYIIKSTFLARDNTVAFTPTADYHPATKQYVDSKTTLIEPFYCSLLTKLEYKTTGNDTTINTADARTRLGNALTQAANDNFRAPNIILYGEEGASPNNYHRAIAYYRNRPISEHPTTIYYDCFYPGDETGSGAPNTWYCKTLKLSCSWSGNTCTVSNIDTYYNGLDARYLATNNTTAYTPSANYHPATKKYVDDNTHTHSNKTTLDSITAQNVTDWGTASTNSHSHSNKTTLDTITAQNITDWSSAVTNSHTHTNKTVLDGISSNDITNWNKVHIYSGTSTPGAGTGENGDIYVKYTA